MSATRQLNPHNFVAGLVAAGDRPLHHLDDQIAAAEEHQLAPVLMRAVERHIEPEPRAVECGGPLRILSRDHDVIEAQDRRA
jgi:hypothetical protein